MEKDNRQMWADLGMDLEAHDQLLDTLNQAYRDIYLAQENRPEGMKYFDSAIGKVHGQRIQELRREQEQGRKIIGSYCVFVPEEIVLAGNATLVGLCSGADFAMEEVEKVLPRNTCALIKSSFGFKLGKVCPFLEVSDMIVGENTCDGKKKSYETLKDMVRRMYIMDLPQMKTDESRGLLKSEFKRFLREVEDLTGTEIDAKKLKQGIETVNAKRRAMARLQRLRRADPSPISGLDGLLVNQVFFYDNPERFTESVNALCDELEKRVQAGEGAKGKGTPRVLVSGCPMAVPNWKMPYLVEGAGGVIVGEESCVGERGNRNQIDESGDSLDELIDALVDRYLGIECAIFTPNPERLEQIKTMAENTKADGVLHYSLQFCQPYIMESIPVEKALEDEDIPTLRVETDYGMEDAGQLKTRIEAFLEMLR